MENTPSLPNDSRARAEISSPTSVQIDISVTRPHSNDSGSSSRVNAYIEHESAGVIATEVGDNGFYARTFYPVGYLESDALHLRRSWRTNSRNLSGPELENQLVNTVGYDQALSHLAQDASNRGQRRLLRSTIRIDVANAPDPPTPVLTIAQMNKLAPSVRLTAETKECHSSDLTPTPKCSLVPGGNLLTEAARETWNKLKKIGRTEKASSVATTSRVLRNDEAGEVCVICLEEWGTEGQVVRTLPCGHTMHSICLDEWIQITAKCPIDNGILQPTKTRDY